LVSLPNNLMMASTSDPLSLIPSLGLQESAWLSVQLMANDMATTGFAPQYAQFVLNLPASLSKSDFRAYWQHIDNYCKRIGIAITGGHTGFIPGQESTIAGGGTFTSIIPSDKVLTSACAQEGDAILMTKSCAISSAAILAMSFPNTVQNKAGKEIQQSAAEQFFATSSLEDALAAVGNHEDHGITAMHDVTEGGVLGAVYEMMSASEKGAIIRNKNIAASEVQQAVCKVFDLDMRYCIGAGSMIITCNPNATANVIERLAQQNIDCTEIGLVTNDSSGIQLIENEIEKPLPYFEEDPYWAAFFNAIQLGWN
jgi:hydrogenase maturation factor